MPDIVIAFFALGLLAGLVKSDLKVPVPVYEILTILLMLSIGIKGGLVLNDPALSINYISLIAVTLLGVLVPLIIYPLLRYVVGLDAINAVSVTAHYGSVSAGTFAVAWALADSAGLTIAPETTLYLVLLELPAIILALAYYQNMNPQKAVEHRMRDVWIEALTSRGVLLLVGGLLIGWAYGPEGLAPVEGALIGGFKTLLALFLLEMGLTTAQVFRPAPWQHWRLISFAALAPFALAWLGIGMGMLLELPNGSLFILAALTASASYIAAPAAIRAAIKEADVGLAMLAALGVTFPINVLLHLPWLVTQFSAG
jgi:uncharacterized protein